MKQEVYRSAILIREFENLLLSLYSEGKLNGTVHTCVGQELTAVYAGKYARKEDTFFSNHRGHGHYIAKTNDVRGLLAEILGKVSGCSSGFGGSQHLYFDEEFYSNGIQGGMTPVASGFAFSKAMRGSNGISFVFIGDGTLGEGTLYESFNLAALFNVPVVFILENNKYAQSTSFDNSFRGSTQKRVEGFGIPYFRTNIWDELSMDDTFNSVIELVRTGSPALIEVESYRLNSHSKGDDNRDPDEIEHFKTRDLLNVFEIENPEIAGSIRKDVIEYLDGLLEEIIKDETLTIIEPHSKVLNQGVDFEVLHLQSDNLRVNEILYRSFSEYFNENKDVVMIGEDIEYKSLGTASGYGGAFKVTKDLSEMYVNRVKNTPISESAITGFAIGMALQKRTSIVEIMFGDFVTLTVDQIIQHASKFGSMFKNDLSLPFILRTPMGGRRGYGPTHSQSLEKLFFGLPNVRVIALNYRILNVDILTSLYRSVSKPTIIIENKVDYTLKPSESLIRTHTYSRSIDDLPTLVIKPKGMKSEVTIFTYGGCLQEVEAAAELLYLEHELAVEIICPLLISPINIYPIFCSVKETSKLLTIEEGSSFSGLGSEIIAQLSVEGVKFERVRQFGNENVLPSSFPAEISLLPNRVSIAEEILKMCSYV